MKRFVVQAICSTALIALVAPAMSHDCRVRDAYLQGEYEGACEPRTELPWEDGARLEGSFKEGRAHGAGVYISARGVRYEGQFANGKLEGLKAPDCPSALGPLSC